MGHIHHTEGELIKFKWNKNQKKDNESSEREIQKWRKFYFHTLKIEQKNGNNKNPHLLGEGWFIFYLWVKP